MYLPKFIKVRQTFKKDKLENIEESVFKEVEELNLNIKSGDKIAITAGSRGVANIALITKSLVSVLKNKGAEPFIVPAMGSHGGATAEGQKQVLESYGITEDYVKAPIKSSMQVVELPQGDLKNKVYMDKYAHEADYTILVNRIKAHTDFVRPIESGLMKMAVIGLGKHEQAKAIHNYGVYGLSELIVPTARQILKHGNILMGLGIVENAYDETLMVKAIKNENIEEEEKKLLKLSKEHFPSLPVKELEILILDRIGKDISGTGMDTNIVGRRKITGVEDPKKPNIKTIITTDITESSHGNATGMGIAEIITKRLKDKIDYKVTYANAITSTFPERAKMPIVAEDDLQALDFALKISGPKKPEDKRIIRIKDTLHLSEMFVTKPVYEEIKNYDNIAVVGNYIDIINNNNFVDFE